MSNTPFDPPIQPTATEIVPSSQASFAYIIGDIGITSDTVVTPNGNCPLAGSTWIVRDESTTAEKIPTWAIVMAILFAAACLLGLLFLLVKERRTTGYVEVTVRGGNLFHVVQIPIHEPAQVVGIRDQVNQVQSRAVAAAGNGGQS